jgi:hypothetical protein
MKTVCEGALELKPEINLDTLKAYFRMRFPNREMSDDTDISGMISELDHAGYRRLDQLDEKVKLPLPRRL